MLVSQPSLRVCLLPFATEVGEFDANIENIVTLSHQALEKDPKIDVCFLPELSLCGYFTQDLALSHTFITEVYDALSHLHHALKDLPVSVVVGCPLAYRDDDSYTQPEHIVSGYRRRANTAVVFNAPVGSSGVDAHAVVLPEPLQDAPVFIKRNLPNYRPFNDARVFAAPPAHHHEKPPILHTHGVAWSVIICEDAWYGDRIAQIAEKECHFIGVINGSPFTQHKPAQRIAHMLNNATKYDLTLGYVNLFGGQDGIIFDGHTFVVNPRADLNNDDTNHTPQRAVSTQYETLFHPEPLTYTYHPIEGNKGNKKEPFFEKNPDTPVQETKLQEIHTSEVSSPKSVAKVSLKRNSLNDTPWEEQTYLALCLGLRDYVYKNGFDLVLIGISGGIDSALVATLAVDVLGAQKVRAFQMPSRFNSIHTRLNAQKFITQLAINEQTIAIDDMMKIVDKVVIGNLSEQEKKAMPQIVAENVQSRLRGLILMTQANRLGGLVLTTGNKSEGAVGYFTQYGDSCGAYAPIGDLYKGEVYHLCHWRNALDVDAWTHNFQLYAGKVPISNDIITTPPSAELNHSQKDTDSLPPYPVLDALLRWLLDPHSEESCGAFFSRYAPHITPPDAPTIARVRELIWASEHKRQQLPPCSRVSDTCFNVDRRVPISRAAPTTSAISVNPVATSVSIDQEKKPL